MFGILLFFSNSVCYSEQLLEAHAWSISVTQYGTLRLFAALNTVLPEALPAWPPPEVYLGPP